MFSGHALLLRHLRALPARRPLLLWLLAFVVLLKAAVPLLAAVSAQQRGLPVAAVCSAYGVRTLAADPADDTSRPTGDAVHAGAEHCALMPLLGGLLVGGTPVAAVFLHAPARAHAVRPAAALPPHDAGRAWLAARVHAPPSSFV